MIVRELFARLGFDVDRASLSSAESQIKGLKSGLVGLAGILVAGKVTQALIGIVKGTAELGDEIKSTAARIGVSTQALQELRFAGGLANVSSEELQGGLRVLARQAFDAAKGGAEAGDGFRALGVSVTDSKGKLKSTEQLLTELGDGFARTGSETERVALAQKVFGRSGAALLPLLSQGSKAIAAQRAEFESLGGLLDGQLIELGDEFTDNQLRMQTALQGVKNIIAKALLPALNKASKQMAQWIAKNREWIGQGFSRVLKDTITVLASVARAVADVVRFNVEFIRQLSPIQKGLLGIVAIALVLAAVFASPVLTLGLFLALLALIIQDFEVFREGGASAIGDVIDGGAKLLAQWGVFGDVLKEIGAEIGFVFTTATNVVGTFVEFVGNILNGEFAFAFESAFKEIRSLWEDTIGFMIGRIEFAAGLAKKLLPSGLVDFLASAPIAALRTEGALGTAGLATAQAAVRSPASVFTSGINAAITIVASPGMNPEQVATAVTRQMDEHQAVSLRNTLNAFSPAR